jgi:hypothetical protein
MNDNSPWCPTCSGRKGQTLVCDRCYGRLPDHLKDAVIRAKEALWQAEAKCLIYLETLTPAVSSAIGGAG